MKSFFCSLNVAGWEDFQDRYTYVYLYSPQSDWYTAELWAEGYKYREGTKLELDGLVVEYWPNYYEDEVSPPWEKDIWTNPEEDGY